MLACSHSLTVNNFSKSTQLASQKSTLKYFKSLNSNVLSALDVSKLDADDDEFLDPLVDSSADVDILRNNSLINFFLLINFNIISI
jgi:hypothetical protein